MIRPLEAARTLLFLGQRNAARSQMAQGFAQEWGHSGLVIDSAGLEPTRLSPWAVQVMAEVGIDITGQSPKALASVDASGVDFLIVVAVGLDVPRVFAGIPRLEWSIEDPDVDGLPGAPRLIGLRTTRDVLRDQVARLHQTLLPLA